jgi:hypothetical protein
VKDLACAVGVLDSNGRLLVNNHWVYGVTIDKKIVVDYRGTTFTEVNVPNIWIRLLLLLLLLLLYLLLLLLLVVILFRKGSEFQ